jgi:hypothetical protein
MTDTAPPNVVQLEHPGSPPENGGAPASVPRNIINDDEFMTGLYRLRQLRSFLNNEAVVLGLSPADSETLGYLFTLKSGFRGRPPTGGEWTALDNFNQLFFQTLTEAQRRRFLLGGIPHAFARLPIIFVAISLVALLVSVVLPFVFQSLSWDVDTTFTLTSLTLVSCYLLWLISMGGMGSISFIGINALSVQQDVTFDLLNPRLINLRVALGALFALVFTLPFGYVGYANFINVLTGQRATPIPSPLDTSDSLMLVLPFLLGFSTSLVIMILNRMLEAAQSFFGRTLITTAPTTSSSAGNASLGTAGQNYTGVAHQPTNPRSRSRGRSTRSN